MWLQAPPKLYLLNLTSNVLISIPMYRLLLRDIIPLRIQIRFAQKFNRRHFQDVKLRTVSTHIDVY